MPLSINEIHVWIIELSNYFVHETTMLESLDNQERLRATAFRLPLHRQRFTAAHGILRSILAAYTNTAANQIQFDYNEYKKPVLSSPRSPVAFNLSHSDDIAVLAVTMNQSIGIDIEKIKPTFNHSVANRFFSDAENQFLSSLPDSEKSEAFYRLWARKESVIKALGKGLFVPLPSFSVLTETINLENQSWVIYPLNIVTGYQAALTCQKSGMQITYHDYFLHHNKLGTL